MRGLAATICATVTLVNGRSCRRIDDRVSPAATTPEKAASSTPAPAAAAAPAATGPAPRTGAPAAPAAPPVKPDPPYVVAAKQRRKIPFWAMATLSLMPIWGFIYVRALTDGPTVVEGPLGEGVDVYSNCASCHGADGGGGVGYPFTNGEVLQTFALFAHEAEPREQESAGESFEPVDGLAVAAFRAGGRDARVVRGGVDAGSREKTVGIRCPVGATTELERGRRRVTGRLLAHHSPLNRIGHTSTAFGD